MHGDNTVFNFAPVSVVLTTHAGRAGTALADTRFVDQSNGFRMSMVPNDNLLTAIPQSLLISLDRFRKTL
jgi:hypothetical protein